MTTLTKLLDRHARPAQVLLKRARTIALTHAQRDALPAHLDADGAHLHHTLAGHRAIEVGDVLLDEGGKFWRVDAAPEPLMQVTGSIDTLLKTAYALGAQHVRVAVGEGALWLVPDDALRTACERAGLTVASAQAAFRPEPQPDDHAHHHGHDHADHHAHHDCGHDHDHGHHHGHDHG